ncbi:uncharacterized protein PHACADRAFT_211594 [Phanerochaete carnosa HHB-10118-sp]|uniref:Cytochrome P450 n=1 Tax=Phanerochaete carnosa (strain HHB-10118-sp) TaxID=650164 RepID=K5WPT0_PHACS|nr:uncharacterized protein PHACADRAFT_211594 [Phanerochaete carnosa HHB-10118-sp]EKM52322.1 hypothetical protein PHACADRAFT_211594 [Phanerochaete carnosa HHB-10118-sp]
MALQLPAIAVVLLTHLRGPKNTSILLVTSRNAMKYGGVWRLQALLGVNVLVLADPKAIHHVIQQSAYDHPKTLQLRVTMFNLTGRSILWAPSGYSAFVVEGHSLCFGCVLSSHYSSALQTRSDVIHNQQTMYSVGSGQLSQLWKEQVLAGRLGGTTVQVHGRLARTTLDIIGEAAFGFDFGALDNTENEVSKAYHKMFADSQLYPSVWSMVFQAMWSLIPEPLLFYIRYLPTRENARYRYTLKVMDKLSGKLIKERSREVAAGNPDVSRKDVLSLLVRANMSESLKMRLSDEETRSQIGTMTLSGHETTTNTLTWMLWGLSKRVDIQDGLRGEIAEKRREISASGACDSTLEDLESMPLLQAVIKETLRFHPIGSNIWCVASKDDVIPLEKPILTRTGETISEIPIAAGQVVVTSFCSYNRIADVWGEDAHEWNPMRFVERDTQKQTKVGMFANLWRFAVIEMQTLIVELVENFKFSIPDDNADIIRTPTLTMGPMIKGRIHEGFQMLLHVVPV